MINLFDPAHRTWERRHENPLACITVALLAAQPPLAAQAATDRKIVHGPICQPERPADATKLRYTGRGVLAKDADVELVCPIVRDSTLNGLKSVTVSFKRGFGTESIDEFNPTNDPKRQGQFHIEFLSCGDLDTANACSSSGPNFGSSENPSHPNVTNFSGIPMDDEREFVIKTTLPRGTVLNRISFTENLK